jgi:hypothetical protein
VKITFDATSIDFMLEAIKPTKCAVCNVDINSKNWGGAYKKKFFCTNLNCLIPLANMYRLDSSRMGEAK